jgi:hypothetical protein
MAPSPPAPLLLLLLALTGLAVAAAQFPQPPPAQQQQQPTNASDGNRSPAPVTDFEANARRLTDLCSRFLSQRLPCATCSSIGVSGMARRRRTRA